MSKWVIVTVGTKEKSVVCFLLFLKLFFNANTCSSPSTRLSEAVNTSFSFFGDNRLGCGLGILSLSTGVLYLGYQRTISARELAPVMMTQVAPEEMLQLEMRSRCRAHNGLRLRRVTLISSCSIQLGRLASPASS